MKVNNNATGPKREAFTLIMPLLNLSSGTKIPIEYIYTDTSYMNCINSLLSIDLSKFTRIVLTVHATHNERYDIYNQLNNQLNRAIRNKHMPNINFMIYVEHNITSSQAETVYNTIKHLNIYGSIFIKDGDNICVCDDIKPANTVTVFPIEECHTFEPLHKSYVMIDDNCFVMNIIEKKVVSNLFNCGGYSFVNAQEYINAYDNVKKYADYNYHICISHIIYYMMLRCNTMFRPTFASKYYDPEIDKEYYIKFNKYEQ